MNPDKYSQIVQKITAHIQRTLSYCSGVSQEQFMADRMLQEACIFNVLQVGELAARAIEYGFVPAILGKLNVHTRGLEKELCFSYLSCHDIEF